MPLQSIQNQPPPLPLKGLGLLDRAWGRLSSRPQEVPPLLSHKSHIPRIELNPPPVLEGRISYSWWVTSPRDILWSDLGRGPWAQTPQPSLHLKPKPVVSVVACLLVLASLWLERLKKDSRFCGVRDLWLPRVQKTQPILYSLSLSHTYKYGENKYGEAGVSVLKGNLKMHVKDLIKLCILQGWEESKCHLASE
jgi:hypothetical protein